MIDNNEENLRKEYEVCFDNWRFFVGLRFTVLAFFLTLNSGLLYAFFGMMDKSKQEWFVFFPPLIGIISVFAALVIENRNRQLYYPCILRAKEIEKKLGYEENKAEKVERTCHWGKKEKLNISELAKKNCIAVLLDNCCPVTFLSWQTQGIRIVYALLAVIWVILLLVSCFMYLFKIYTFLFD